MWQVYPFVWAMDEKCEKMPEIIFCWGDKANDLYGIKEIYRYFPQGKVIFVLRDPRGAVSSLAKRMAVKERASFEAAVNVTHLIEACIDWRHMTQRMLRLAMKHPRESLLVRFEAVLEFPFRELNRIFTFLSVPNMGEDSVRERLRSASYGASNDPLDTGTGISTRPIDRWRGFLGEAQVKDIETITGETAHKAGYGIHRPGSMVDRARLVNKMPSPERRAIAALKLAYLDVREKFIPVMKEKTSCHHAC